jgi:uncharacterized membrane protein
VIIVCSAIVSWLLTNIGIDQQKLEMASIANTFLPPICGAVSLLVFVLIDFFFVQQRRFWILIFILINLGVGIAIRLESESIIRSGT